MGAATTRVRARAALVAGLIVLALALGSCAGSDGGAADVGATTTTVDPLSLPAVDACGNDLSDLHSTVWGVDPTDGSVRWRTSVPLASPFVLHDPSGDPRLSLVLRTVEVVVDANDGHLVATAPGGVHEVLVEPATDGASEAVLLVDGVRQPATIEVAGLEVTTAAGETGQATVGLTATDPATAAPVWRVELGAADAVAGLSPPVVFGGTVVVVTSPPRPPCP